MRDLEPSVPGGETRVVVRARIVESPPLLKQPDSTRSGVHQREAVGQRENEGAETRRTKRKRRRRRRRWRRGWRRRGKVDSAKEEERFLGARSRTKGARNVRL